MKRYLTLWLALTAVLLLATATINLVVDPYGIFRIIDARGFNAVKPKAGVHGAMTKAYQVLRVQPRGLILGNSRAEVGFDPAYAAWPETARPVFNLTLPGTGTRTTLLYLRHVLEAQKESPPTIVVWGIDFMDFLTDRHRIPQRGDSLGKNDLRLLANPDGTRNPARWLARLRDGAEATVSLGALLDSFITLQEQKNPYAENLTPLGFNPMRDYLKITADEGYWAVFRQKDIEHIKAYSKRPRDLVDSSGASSPALDDLRRVIALCREHGIDLRLVLYPYHAHLLETIYLTGHWQAFENWKRAITHIAHDEALAAGLTPIPLWDFSRYTVYSQSAIPEKGDKKSTNPWYWEAGHFKRELGERVLAQVLSDKQNDNDIGILLNGTNLDAELANQRTLADAYRAKHAPELRFLAELASKSAR